MGSCGPCRAFPLLPCSLTKHSPECSALPTVFWENLFFYWLLLSGNTGGLNPFII